VIVGGRAKHLAVAALAAFVPGAGQASASAPARSDFLAPLSHTCSADPCGAPAGSIALSPDGANVYVAAVDRKHRGGITAFSRNAEDGTLTRIECIREAGGSGCERPGSAENSRRTSIAVSPDGLLVALVSSRPPAAGLLTIYRRDPQTGALTRAACASDRPRTTGCAAAPHLGAARRVIFGPAGRLYVLATYFGDPKPSGLTAFDLDAAGTPTQTACVTENGSDGECSDGTGVSDAGDLAFSPDGTTLFVAGGTVGVAAYRSDLASGALTQTGCLSVGGRAGALGYEGACGRGFSDAGAIVPGPAGRMLVGSSRGVFDVALGADGRPRVVGCYGLRRRRCDRVDRGRTHAYLIRPGAGGHVYVSAFLEVGGAVLFEMSPAGADRLRVTGCTGGFLLPTMNLGCSVGSGDSTDLVASSDGEDVYAAVAGDLAQGRVAGYALAAGVTSPRARGRGATRTVRVRCSSGRRRCRGIVDLRLASFERKHGGKVWKAGPPLGKAPFNLGPRRSTTVVVPLRPAARRRLSGEPRSAIATVSDSTGLTDPTVAPLVLR
jgi:hypothetical protein